MRGAAFLFGTVALLALAVAPAASASSARARNSAALRVQGARVVGLYPDDAYRFIPPRWFR